MAPPVRTTLTPPADESATGPATPPHSCHNGAVAAGPSDTLEQQPAGGARRTGKDTRLQVETPQPTENRVRTAPIAASQREPFPRRRPSFISSPRPAPGPGA